MLEESVIYQDILQKGEQRGLQRGLQQGLELGEKKLALRLLEQRLGKLPLKVRRRIERLAGAQLEALGDALLSFQTQRDLLAWFKQQAARG